MTDASKLELLLRGIGRRTDFLKEKSLAIETPEQYLHVVNDKSKRKLILRYLRSPVELFKKGDRIGGVKLQRMKLVGETENQTAVESDQPDSEVFQNLHCDVLIKSIGYKSLEMPGVPFDTKRNVIPNSFGCVKDPTSSKLEVGLYCAGWVKRGPVGIIDATLRDSMETFRIIKHHLEGDLLPERLTPREEIVEMLGPDLGEIVTMEKWVKIRDFEIEAGKADGKLKEKILGKAEMLSVANK
jgi:NADPH-dependent glutamate synthase beta subunit-like oxidoreductase